MRRARVSVRGFNPTVTMPYELSTAHLALTMERLYECLDNVNRSAAASDLPILETWCGKSNLSSLVSASFCNALSDVSEILTANTSTSGFPDLLVAGRHRNDAAASGTQGVEIKTTSKRTLAVDAHGARPGWYLIVQIAADTSGVQPTFVSDLYIAKLTRADFRIHDRNTAIGTRTARINRRGCTKLRAGHVYHHGSVA
jgi:hypothetical protein